MPNEATEQSADQERVPAVPPGASEKDNVASPDEGETHDTSTAKDGTAAAVADEKGDSPKEPTEDRGPQTETNRLRLMAKNSQVGLMTAVSGSGSNVASLYVDCRSSSPDSDQNLDGFVTIANLQLSERSYRTLDESQFDAYSGALFNKRILLLSCHDDDIALNVAKRIAYRTDVGSKTLVTLDKNAQGNYNFRNLVNALGPVKKETDSKHLTRTVCVWPAYEPSDDDISNSILRTLLVDNATIEQYQDKLSETNMCMICLVSPVRIREYKESRLKVLQIWEIDFLCPLLETYSLNEYASLAETIQQQRQAKLWSLDSSEFYREIARQLKAGTLLETVANRPLVGANDNASLSQLFNRADPLMDAVLYCATYFPNLSPQDFSYLVELYLGDTTEEVVKPADRTASEAGDQPANVVEAVPLARRWRWETDAILRRCKLTSVRNENDKRVVDFQVDGLRSRLSQHIRDEHYFFYESSFNLLRRRGLLFSPKREMAEGARQLLVEMASQYEADEAAAWLYEVIDEFEQLAEAADLLQEHSGLFQLLPDNSIKAARHYVGHGLRLVLNRLNGEPNLQDVVRAFWQRLLRFQQQWFLDLLRRMGSVPPPETLNWLKQLLDQGTKEIRRQALDYLVGHLVRQDTLVYASLNEIMRWPATSQAGQAAQEILIIYCVASNRQLPQTEYGRWPSSHPLFGFQDDDEARKCLSHLIGWLFRAAYEVNPDSAPLDIADIVAGWYFVLTPSDQLEPNIVDETSDMLTTQSVRSLLLTIAVRHCSRQLKNSLLERWSEMKSDILEEVIRLEAFDHFKSASLSSELMSNVAIVRRKLKDTRARLSELRQDFVRAEEIASIGGSTNEQYG